MVAPKLSTQEVAPLNAPRKSVSEAGKVFASTARLGATLFEIGRRMKAEHDTSRAQSALVEFRGQTRAIYSEMVARRGGDASGVSSDYKEQYDKLAGEYFTRFDNEVQQTLFSDRATQRREHDLDSLAVHEAAENQVHLRGALAGTISNANNEAELQPFNEPLANDLEVDIVAGYALTFPGENKTAEINRDIAAFRTQRLLSMAATQPEIALEQLEKWKGSLGGAHTTLKVKLDDAGVLKASIDHSTRIQGLTSDHADQLKLVGKISNAKEQTKTREIIRAQQHDENRIEKEREEELKDSLTDGIIESNTLTEALAVANKADGTLRKDLIRFANDKYTLTPAQKQKQTIEQAINQSDIVDDLVSGKDITIEELKDRFRKGNINKTQFENIKDMTDPKKSIPYTTALKRIDFARTNNVFSDSKIENNRQWAAYKKIIDDYVAKFPDYSATELEAYIDEMMKPLEGNWFLRLFGVGTVEQGLEERREFLERVITPRARRRTKEIKTDPIRAQILTLIDEGADSGDIIDDLAEAGIDPDPYLDLIRNR